MGKPAIEAAPRSPEREALAQAIARHQRAEQRIERIESIFLGQLIAPAEDRVLECERLLAKAKKREPQRIVSELLGDTFQPWPTLIEVESDLEEARANLKLAERTRDALDIERREALAEMENATRVRRDAVKDVLKAEARAEALLRKFNDLKLELERQREVLRYLDTMGCLPFAWDKVLPFQPRGADTDWSLAVVQLEQDPDAPLPPG